MFWSAWTMDVMFWPCDDNDDTHDNDDDNKNNNNNNLCHYDY